MNDKLKNNKLDNSILEKAKTKEEKKRLIEDAGMELTDEDMEKVSGGGPPPLEQIRKGEPGENGQ